MLHEVFLKKQVPVVKAFPGSGFNPLWSAHSSCSTGAIIRNIQYPEPCCMSLLGWDIEWMSFTSQVKLRSARKWGQSSATCKWKKKKLFQTSFQRWINKTFFSQVSILSPVPLYCFSSTVQTSSQSDIQDLQEARQKVSGDKSSCSSRNNGFLR